MKRFRLNILICLLLTALFSALSAWLFISGKVPQGIFAAAGAVLSVAVLLSMVRKLMLVMNTFVRSLEMDDMTMRFEAGGSDGLLREMADSMNRLMEIYRGNTLQLETSKLYYDRILRIMTHEMRNSITPVIAISNDMEKHPEKYTGENLDDAVNVIKGQSEGIKRFLDSYYRLTQLPAPEMSEINVMDFFGKIRRLIAVEMSQRGLDDDVCVYVIGQGMTMNADASLMRQVMVNLIRNALDAVAGVVNPSVKVTATVSDGHPLISVEDNGPGIAPEIRDMLFQPFVTTKKEGSGVGLSLSRQIVRQHGGDLRISGTAGQGVKVVVTLP